ncbi:MAG: glycoside hydrolase family 3 C-terminal domain-containing protein [Prevotella sp.]|jgi:beta-glucosidase
MKHFDMKSKSLKIFVISALALLPSLNFAQEAPKLRADNIDEVIKAMTLEEKAQLLVGGGNDGFVGSGAMLGHQKKLVAGAAGITVAIPRLGIPATVLTDGPAGVHIDPVREGDDRTFYATGFPIGTCLASSWNVDLVRRVGECIGNETREYGCDVVLAPGMNLHRSPLCGRNFEYYSEDPVLTGFMGSAMVLGVQSQGVGTSPKHFAVNSQEGDRTRVDERVSQRALRELYLRGFEMMVRNAKPWTIMAAYNKINGVYAQNNKDLLTTILRKEWGFDGLVMTDWIGVRPDLPTWTETDAGDELLMPGYGQQVKDILEAVQTGKLSRTVLDEAVRRVLSYIVKTPHFKNYTFSNKPDLKAHAAVTRQCSTEGMVLLKNAPSPASATGAPTLPITGLKRVALFGVNSYDFMSGGLGSGCVNVPYVIDMKQGLKNVGVETTTQLTDIYLNYIKYAKLKLQADKNPEMWFLDQGQPKLPEINISQRCAETAEKDAEAAIITIGRQAGEGMDRDIDTEFNLSADEKAMISRVSSVFHAAGKPVIVILNSGSVMETASWRDAVDAILVAWQPGEEGGNSVADVLTGKVNPSGRLTMTWPLSVYDVPSTKNFPQHPDYYNLTDKFNNGDLKGVNYSNHEEDIYVGYRYFDSFRKTVAYPFGYGLSYTTFDFRNAKVSVKGDKIEVQVTVTNTGKIAGKQVAQVYVAAPKGKIEKPTRELKAFAKTKILQPGEHETLHMTIDRRLLTSFDETGSRWLGEAGRYEFQIGDNVEHILCSASLNLKEYSEPVNDVMKLQVNLQRLKR